MESAAHQFAVASNVERIEDSVWAANIAPDWDILGSTNGGYLLATIARAMSGATERPNPLTITGHYLAPVTAQPIQITTNVLKSGKNIATATGTMFGDGRPLVTALGALSHANRSHETSLTDGSPPDLPSPEDSVRLRLPDGDNSQRVNGMPPPFADKVDLRLHPQDIGFAIGKPSGIPRMRAWFQLPNGEPLDVFALILAADSLPPTVFNSGLPIAWTPTVELTVHVRAMPEPGWLRLDYQTRFISNGLLEVDGLIWDSTDRLVAQSRQLALVPEMP
jgi:acyl-CoA thioesterase